MAKNVVLHFKAFMKEYRVIGVAVAFVIGTAALDMCKSIVRNLIMPFVNLLIPGGEWQTSSFEMAGARIGTGQIINDTLSFLLILLVVFIIVKYIIKE